MAFIRVCLSTHSILVSCYFGTVAELAHCHCDFRMRQRNGVNSHRSGARSQFLITLPAGNVESLKPVIRTNQELVRYFSSTPSGAKGIHNSKSL
jgi:hypothetical protein